jgi:hypothetical protein
MKSPVNFDMKRIDVVRTAYQKYRLIDKPQSPGFASPKSQTPSLQDKSLFGISQNVPNRFRPKFARKMGWKNPLSQRSTSISKVDF